MCLYFYDTKDGCAQEGTITEPLYYSGIVEAKQEIFGSGFAQTLYSLGE